MYRLKPGTEALPPLLFLLLLLLKPTLEQQSGDTPTNTTAAAQPLSSLFEFRALLQLRSSLGLRAKEWPIKEDPCTIWVGITCRNGSVVGINVSRFRRTRIGRLKPQFAVDALSNLTRLEVFNASFLVLPGEIPGWFGQSMDKLQVIDLRSCSIVGAIPASFGNLTRLTALVLSQNKLSGQIPTELGELASLSVLDVSMNSLTGSIPDSFSSLRNLTVLDISSNYLFGPIPPGIGILSKLKRLNCSRNSLTATVPGQLGDLSNLVDLDLSSNLLSNLLPSDLTGMKSLRTMLLGKNRLSGELPDGSFRPLTQLEQVDLSHNVFSGAIPDVLWSMSSLQVVDVSGNNLTGTLPVTALASNTTGLLFNLSGNMYYGQLTSVIQRLSFVDVSGNYFEGKVPVNTGRNASLDANCLQSIKNQRSSEDCTSFYKLKGLVFDNFGLPNTIEPLGHKPPKKSHKKTIILASVLGGLGLLLLLFLLLFMFLCIRRRGRSNQRGNGVGPIPTAATPQSPGVAINFASLGETFTMEQLVLASNGFSEGNLIKHGHSGDLYRGLLEGGIPVVIKKVDLNAVRKEAYLLELDFFSKVSHPRLVPLLGHCLENENEKYIVFKYLPNGDLSSSLYRKVNSNDDSLQSLDWITRLKIAIGAAEGLCYLHHECTPPFVHRDVQASSILLDDKFEVRLGSLSELGVQEGDGRQSMVTRLLRIPQTSEQGSSDSHTSTCAYDVYCFGKVLLELVTGNLGMSASSDASTKEWINQTVPYISIHDKELITKIVDPSLIVDEDLLEEVWAMAIVARSCLNPKPSRRPLMRYILKALENPLKVVREENMGSGRLRTTSSRGSWNAAVFGSWRHSSSDVAAPANVGGPSSVSRVVEGVRSSFRQSGTSESQGSGGGNGNSNSNSGRDENSASRRRQSTRDVFPEPFDVERRSGE